MNALKVKGYIYVLISALGFSIVPLLAKYTLDAGMNSETMLSYRFIIAGVFFLLYTGLSRTTLIIPFKHALQLCGIGILYALESMIFFEAFKYISPGFGQLLFQVHPLMVALAAYVVFKEKLTWQVVTALCLVVIGCGLLFWEPSSFVTLTGVVLVLMAAVFYTTYIIVGKDLLDSIEPVVVTTYLTVSCGVFLTCYTLMTDKFMVVSSLDIVIAIGIFSIFSTIIAILAFSAGLQLLSATVASILCALEPVITVILAYVIFGETLTWLQLVGAAFIVCSIIIIDYKSTEAVTIENEGDLI